MTFKSFNHPGYPPEDTLIFGAELAAAAASNQVLIAGVAGSKIVVSRITFVCSNTVSVDVAARVGFHTTTTPAVASCFAGHPGIKAATGGGVVEGTGGGALAIGGDGESLLLTSSISTGGSLYVFGTYGLVPVT